jgi:hypothetical protein
MALQMARALWGGALLLAPRRVLRPGEPRSSVEEGATRILGARQLAEVAILARRGRSAPPRWTIAVDVVHAASMLALAACSRRYRRDALISLTAAVFLTTWGEVERRQLG